MLMQTKKPSIVYTEGWAGFSLAVENLNAATFRFDPPLESVSKNTIKRQDLNHKQSAKALAIRNLTIDGAANREVNWLYTLQLIDKKDGSDNYG